MYVRMYMCHITGRGTRARDHFRAKREHLNRLRRLLPESQGQNLAVTVSLVPCSLVIDSGLVG